MATPDDNAVGSRPGSLDDGFNLVAKDLDRAFALAFNHNEAVIMVTVREQSWNAQIVTRQRGGPRPDPVPVRLNLARLAKESGLNRSRLSTALRGLVAGKILDRTPDGLLIRKDYAKWLDAAGKEPRFTPQQLTYIRRGKRRGRAPKSVAECNGEVLQNATPATPECCDSQQQVLPNATPSVAKRNTKCCKTQHPHIEERASEDLEIGDSRDSHTHSAREGSQPQRSKEDLSEVHEAARILSGDLRTSHLGINLLREHSTPGLLPLEGWRFILAANRQLGPTLKHSQRTSWGYFVAIARNLTEAERDEAPDPVAPSAKQAAARPTRSEARRREISDQLKALAAKAREGGDAS